MSSDYRKKNVLIIEDDNILSQLIKRKIKTLEFEAKFAKTIEEGTELLNQYDFDLLLLDYNLPDGTVEDLFNLKPKELPPFIIMTANGDQQLAVDMMKSGAKDYLVKDQNFIELLPTVIEDALKDIALKEKLAETNQKLREKEREYQFLFENTGVAIVIVDKYNKLLLINKEMEKLTSYTKKELETKNLFDLLIIGDKVAKNKENQNLIKISNQKYEGKIETKKGTIKNVLIKKNSFSEKEWAIVSLMDITDRKVKEKELNQAYNRLNKNISQAHKLHQNFLPSNLFKKNKISGAVYYHPAQELGGDFYNYQKIDNNKFIFYLADVSGHGLDGAMLNISIKEKINNLVANYKSKVKFDDSCEGKDLEPQEIMKSVLQSYLKEDFPDDYFLCLQIAVINFKKGNLLYSNAGFQINPYIIKSTGEIIKLKNADLPISSAINKKLMDFEEEEYSLTPGDKIFLSTDGLIEETNGTNYYGEQRVERLLEKYYYLPVQILKDKIKDNFLEFTTANKTKDDVTFMALEREAEIFEKYQIDSDFAELDSLEKKIMNCLVKITDESNLIKMAIHEMTINAIEHGNQFAADKKVMVDLSITEDYVRVVITDQGPGFDYPVCFEKDLYTELDSERGRGIAVTAKIVDKIIYNQLGNQVCLVKFREN